MAPLARRALQVLATSVAALYPATPGAGRGDVREFVGDMLADGWTHARWRGLAVSMRCAIADLARAWSGRTQLQVSQSSAPGRRRDQVRSSVSDRVLVEARNALRGLTRARAYATTAIGVLAIGIAIATASFALMQGSIWARLPFPDAERLVLLSEQDHAGSYLSIAWPNLQDWRARQQVFDDIGAYLGGMISISGGNGRPERIEGAVVSSAVFTTLGIEPIAGRVFDTRHDTEPLREVVIGEHLWRSRFGGRASIIGEPGAIAIDDQPFTIIGVVAASARFPSRVTEIWASLGPGLDAIPKERGNHPGFNAIARVRRGLSIADARAGMQVIAAALGRDYPEANGGRAITVETLVDVVTAPARPALRALLAGGALLLVVAFVNVAGLTVARASDRHRQRAVHTALGSTARRDFGRAAIEAATIGVTAGAIGLGLAWTAMAALVRFGPAALPRVDLLEIDLRSIYLAGALTIAAIVIVALAARVRVAPIGSGWRRGAVAVQTAIASMLLIGAGLFLRSFVALSSTDLGFTPAHVVTLKVLPAEPRYTIASYFQFNRQLLVRMRTLPGVAAVGLNTVLPLGGNGTESTVAADSPEFGGRQIIPRALYQCIAGDYFAAMKIDLVAGRAFDTRDDDGTPVAIIDEALAATMFKGSAIGRRLAFETTPTGAVLWRDVVGVVKHVKHYGIDDDRPFGQVYLPLMQMPAVLRQQRPSVTFVARGGGDDDGLRAAMRDAVATLDPALPVFNEQPMDRYVTRRVEQPRMRAVVVGVMAAIALIASGVGLYAALMYVTLRRTREMSIRLTLGARPSDLAQLVLRDGVSAGLTGVAVGLAAAFAAAPWLAPLLVVPPRDWPTFAAAAAILTAVILASSLRPARRAAGVDPRAVLDP